ncbi:PLD nuclease N-terminal domain-containing protein [Zongyangia hominis]|uniref:PLDc_N domain-containing protein n=1 Tax=Zongyangia hominis TaxID=2763677 RepID=A0A926IAS3_9FIRM|nr:PLD nuclease N-terminal domain-containing protein [Zongyangia hominis]MBC8569400.1 PLDc_N domain-containing protein [Zongyangia hominis]
MENLMQYIPLLIPVIALEFILMVTALVHVLRHPQYRFGNRVFWVIVVLFVQIIGPVVYFVAGRGEQ